MFALNPVSWRTFPKAIVGVRGFRLSLGGKDLTAAGSQGP